jgi:hypothetical protein
MSNKDFNMRAYIDIVNEVTEDEFEMVFKTNEGEEIQYYIGTRDGAWKTAKKLVSENEGWEIITIGWA